MPVPRKKNIAGYMDEQGRFRPIRKPSYVGASRRKATAKDRKRYSKAKAGDLGKRRQELAREDVFDREIRLERERKEKLKKSQEREWKRIERESLGDQDSTGRGKTLIEFVRSAGGIRPTFKFGGKKYRGKKQSYDFGELEPFTYKQSGKRGLVSEKGKKSLDGMYQAAKESGYAVSDPWDMLNAMDDELKSGKAMYASYGYLDYRDNPKSDLYVAQLGPRSFGVFLKTYLLKKFASRTAAETHIRSIRSKKKVNPSAVRAAKAAISIFDNDLDLDVDAKDLARLQAVTRKLASRRKNGKLKRNPVGWFREVSPVTPEAVKKLYRTLAAKYHPDKGGDTRTMQEINADYDKAMKIAISGEGNEARAKAETSAIKPLREAIEFAVTLPDDVKVVIRGLWLWLEGNTFKAKDQIKSFTSSDGNRFKWASQKKAWFFAAVPSRNRRGEMSFAEIESLYGREDVKDRKSRRALNPGDPITAFSALTGGIASALQIKEMLNRPKRKATPKRKTNGKTTAKPKAGRSNPATTAQKHNEREFNLDIAAIESGNYRKARTAQMHGRLAGYSKREVETLIENAKLKARLKSKLKPGTKKTNPIKIKLHKFYRGQIVSTRSIGDHDIVYSAKIISRTPSMVTFDAGDGVKKAKIHRREDYEYFYPFGRYSMAPTFRSTDKPKSNPHFYVQKLGGAWRILNREGNKLTVKFKTKAAALKRLAEVKKESPEIDWVVLPESKPNPKPPRSRLFEKFQGRSVTSAVKRPVSAHAPAKLVQLGDLIELHLKGGKILKPNPKAFKLAAANGKLWIVGGKIAKPNPAARANEINPIGELTHVVYGTRKPHHGDHNYTHYIHKMGEESGRRPLLCADKDGYPVLRGGNYKIEARGIVD